MKIVRQLFGGHTLLATLVCTAALLPPGAGAAVSEVHESNLDYDDWLEQRGYNTERDRITEIGNWNRRELEGYWPEIEYSYYEWLQISEYYDDAEGAE